MKKSATTKGESPSRLIDARIKELDDWRGRTLSHVRALIKQADPEVVEEWKWRGVPVWYHDGMICTGETYKSVVKLTFAKGASLKDPSGLFNASLEGNVRRAIDLHEGDEVDGGCLQDADTCRGGPEQVLSPIIECDSQGLTPIVTLTPDHLRPDQTMPGAESSAIISGALCTVIPAKAETQLWVPPPLSRGQAFRGDDGRVRSPAQLQIGARLILSSHRWGAASTVHPNGRMFWFR